MKNLILLSLLAIFFLNMNQLSVGANDDNAQQTESAQSSDDELLYEKIERYHKQVDQMLASSAEWVDSFFANDNYTEEENKTYLRTRLSGFIEEGESFDGNFSYMLRLRLPNTQKKWGLRVGSDEDFVDGFDDSPSSTALDRLDEVEDDTNVALEYFFLDKDKHNLKFSGGARIRSGSVVGYGSSRYRYQTEIDDWTMRFTERVRWYEDDGWESRTRQDFERPIRDDLFFRITPGLDWYERKDGLYYNVAASVFHLLSEDHALQYELNNYFHTEVSDHHKEVNVRVRYRRKIWQDWLVLEIAPQLAWYEERDYDTVPGLFIRLETWFGRFPERKIIDY